VSRYQKGKINLDFTEARDSKWQWHQLGHMQVCTSLQTDNHANTSPLSFLQAGCPSCRPTNSVKALEANFTNGTCSGNWPVVWRTRLLACGLVSDVVEITSTRRRGRIHCVVVETITRRRRLDVKTAAASSSTKNAESRRTFNRYSSDLLSGYINNAH